MRYDVIVVGGGLAGSALAKALAERGVRVLVLERETAFKDRVRGEQMHSWGVAEARALGIYDALLKCGGNQTRRWLTYQGTVLVEDRDLVATTPHGVGSFNCYHPAMQETLLGLAVEAGAEVRRGVAVEQVATGDPPSVRVRENGHEDVLTARLVVAADGRASQVRRWGGFTVARDPDCLAIAGTLLAETPIPDDNTYVVRGADGFVLIAPLGGRRARTYFISRKTDDRPPLSGDARVSDFFAACRGTGAPAEWFETATIAGPLAQFSGADHWVEHPARQGVVLVGDAASASDPSYGCGLSLALTAVRRLRDCLLSTADWSAATDEYARDYGHAYGVVHWITRSLTDLRWDIGPEADARRARVLPLLMADPSLVPDFRGLGPHARLDEPTRRLLLGKT